jgi:hypothetical protein
LLELKVNIHLTSLNTLLLHLIGILLNTYLFDVQLFYSREVTFNEWPQPKVDITFCLVVSVYHIFTNFLIILKYVFQWRVEKHLHSWTRLDIALSPKVDIVVWIFYILHGNCCPLDFCKIFMIFYNYFEICLAMVCKEPSDCWHTFLILSCIWCS